MAGSIFHRKRRKLKSEINVVPYIDVMLVLLIIFMITAPLLNVATEINLPQSKARSLQHWEFDFPYPDQIDAEGAGSGCPRPFLFPHY